MERTVRLNHLQQVGAVTVRSGFAWLWLGPHRSVSISVIWFLDGSAQIHENDRQSHGDKEVAEANNAKNISFDVAANVIKDGIL